MKNLLLILFLFYLLGCKSSKINQSINNSKKGESFEVEIKKIDSIEYYYIIYAKNLNNRMGYKIISKKATKSVGVYKIKLNDVFKFKLFWVSDPPEIEKKGNYLEFKRCKTYFPLVNICTEPGYELYETDDLIGLYLKASSTKSVK